MRRQRESLSAKGELVKALVNHGSDIGHTLSCLILEVRRTSRLVVSFFVLRGPTPSPIRSLYHRRNLILPSPFPSLSPAHWTSHIDVSRSPYRRAENSITA